MCSRVGDNLTLTFNTNDSVDQQSLTVSVITGNVPSTLTVDNLDAGVGRSWRVIHTIQPYDDGQLIWQIAGNDRAGNGLEKDPTLLSVQSLNFGQYIENSESFSFEADTTSPKLIGIKFQETNALKNLKYGDNSTRILSSGDNLSLTFDLDEAIDPPNVVLQIGTHFIPDVSATSDNGTNWTVSYQLGSHDEGLLNWAISGKDRAETSWN